MKACLTIYVKRAGKRGNRVLVPLSTLTVIVREGAMDVCFGRELRGTAVRRGVKVTSRRWDSFDPLGAPDVFTVSRHRDCCHLPRGILCEHVDELAARADESTIRSFEERNF